MYVLVAIDTKSVIAAANENAKTSFKKNKLKLKVEVETRNLAEVEEAAKLAGKGIDRIMLDNMDVKTMTEAVKIIAGKCETEASGGIFREQLNEIAKTGVTYISAGALTHSAENIDLSLKAIKN